MTLWMKCNRCKAKEAVAHGYNSFEFTPKQIGQRYRCLGWKVDGQRVLCPEHSGLPRLTAKQVLADFMNFLRLTNQPVIPHPNDLVGKWTRASIFGAKTRK